MPSPPNGPFRSQRSRTNVTRSASDSQSLSVMAITKMSFLEPCAFSISIARQAYPGVGGEVHPLGVVPQGYPGAVEHVRGPVPQGEPANARPGAIALPSRHGQEERDAPAAGNVVHDMGERQVLRADGDPGLLRGHPDRGLDDRLPVHQLAGRRLVGPVAVAGVGAFSQHDVLVHCQQEDDVHYDPATLFNASVKHGTAGSAHSDRLAAVSPNKNPCLRISTDLIRTAQGRARYPRGLVDRHVYKAGEPVDECRVTAGILWTRPAAGPWQDANGGCGEPPADVENCAQNS